MPPTTPRATSSEVRGRDRTARDVQPGVAVMMRSRTEPTEADLVGRARTGDVEAFEVLVRSHDDRMRALAFGMLGSRAAMDDALQDAYVKAFRALPSFRGESRFSTWLHRIVATTCVDHLRRRQRRREDVLTDEPEPIGGHIGDPSGDTVARRLDLRRALDRLDADQRAALLLVDGEGLSYEEAGTVLGIPAGTVSSRLSRARAELRRALTVEPNEGGVR